VVGLFGLVVVLSVGLFDWRCNGNYEERRGKVTVVVPAVEIVETRDTLSEAAIFFALKALWAAGFSRSGDVI